MISCVKMSFFENTFLEKVDFDRDCLCEGQVEVWLNRLMDRMRSSIRYHFNYKLFTKISSK